MTVREWVEGYFRAWDEKDADAAADLFTEQALYRADPYSEPHRGREGVRAYWSGVTATQEDVQTRFGTIVAAPDNHYAAVEFWVTMRNGGVEVTLAGILFLRFDSSGRCEELREAWHFTEGRVDPPPGWGE